MSTKISIVQIVNKKKRTEITNKYVSNGHFALKKEFAKKEEQRALKLYSDKTEVQELINIEKKVDSYFNQIDESTLLELSLFKQETIEYNGIEYYRFSGSDYYFHCNQSLYDYFCKDYELFPCTSKINKSTDNKLKLDYGYLKTKNYGFFEGEIVGLLCFMNF